ncbi:MAG: Flp family type IVb pilin [Vampirovibrionales bacterium]|nr:Flp family type IVb pilin [Vampirovibrionales bacterium]
MMIVAHTLRTPTKRRPSFAGQTMVELALILGLVVLMAIGALGTMGGALKTAWNGEMKPKMEAPEAPLVAAKQTAPTFEEATGVAGTPVTYDISAASADANWDGSALQAGAVNVGTGNGNCDPWQTDPNADDFCN